MFPLTSSYPASIYRIVNLIINRSIIERKVALLDCWTACGQTERQTDGAKTYGTEYSTWYEVPGTGTRYSTRYYSSTSIRYEPGTRYTSPFDITSLVLRYDEKQTLGTAVPLNSSTMIYNYCYALWVASLAIAQNAASFQLGTPPSRSKLSAKDSLMAMKAVPAGVVQESSVNENQATAQEETAKSPYDNFDYMAHWYPVSWEQDLILDRPTKVTVFDTDYVVAKTSAKNGVVCLEDRCPHKSAALSEGRITSTGKFQCAYHGWSFDGETGDCTEIPQIVQPAKKSESISSSGMSSRTCAKAVPAMIHQGMVWIFPGGLEGALTAAPPPTVKELDDPKFKITTVVREFPVDWSILVENILDPDHGVFAHGATSFDQYAADPGNPQQIEEDFTVNNGMGWKITSRVAAVDKLLDVNLQRTGKGHKKSTIDIGRKGSKNAEEEVQPNIATATLTAPNHVLMGRRDPVTNETSFITAFWVCPVGTGRSRFMSCAAGKTPFTIPRWIMSFTINNFLDQDTYLLMGQQKHALLAEAEAALNEQQPSDVRKNTYVYRSPTEKLGARLGAFWDATLSRAPNRLETLKMMKERGDLVEVPSRQIVLDREVQHLKICPSSQDVVKNCKTVKRLSTASVLLLGVMKAATIWLKTQNIMSSTNPVFGLTDRLLNKPSFVASIGLIAGLSFWLAEKLRKQFYFKYDESYRDKDVSNIPKVWMDN